MVYAALLFLSSAFAQDAVTLSAVRYAQDGLSTASVSFHANVSGSLDARLSCDGKSFAASKAISPGDVVTIDLAGLPKGQHACKGTLGLQASDGTSGEMPLSLSVEVLPVLQVQVRPEDLDLAHHELVVRADRPIARASVDVLGEKGRQIGHGELAPGATDHIDLEWSGDASGAADEPIKLLVTAWDAHDLPGRLELSPWSYDIPHEDVVFASDSSTIDASEVPKLEKAWGDLQGVLDKYGEVVQVRLFVAGYTDTVGDAGHNQTLSEARAKAIAQWFRQRGFHGDISYQGFGEGALAVATPDSTDEPRNRRALYVLAAETPARSGDLPRSDWKKLP